MKKSISVFLALLLLVFCAVPAFAAGEGITALQINPYGGDESDIDTVKWFASSGKYFLFLPANTDLSAAKVYFTASDDVTLDGAPVASGDAAAAFTEGEHTLVCGSRSYLLTVCFSASLPAVYITTQSGSLDYIHASKENKEPGNIRVYENGALTVDKELKQIKGRGNATWNYAKKPYNIKFDKKTGVLGMPKAKKWTLLAGHVMDNSLMKNYFALNFGRAIGLPETSECRQIDLYINGEYLGLYLICESVEVGENRVNIVDLDSANEKANPEISDMETLPQMGVRSGYVPGSLKWIDIPQSPEDISGGYLLEVDYLYRYHAEPSGFISNKGMPIVVGSPEYASKAEVEYISALWNKAEEALYSETGFNSAGKHYTECFDMDSLARCYLAEEVTKDVDSGITSFYFYKKAGDDRFYAGPLWDFDHALGSGTTIGNRLTVYEPDTWYANQLHRNSIDSACANYPTFFAQCYSFSDFRTTVCDLWAQTVSQTLSQSVASLAGRKDAIRASAVMNHLRWNTYGSADTSVVSQKSGNDADQLISFLTQRKPALDKGLAVDGAAVVYNENGGSGNTIYDAKIYSVGDTAVALRNSTFTRAGYEFAGWNTKADGTGAAIGENERYTVMENYMVLYAQWKVVQTPTEPEDPPTEPTTNPAPSDSGGDSKGDYLHWLRHILQEIINFWRRVFRIK